MTPRFKVQLKGSVAGVAFELVELSSAPTRQEALHSVLSKLPEGTAPDLFVHVSTLSVGR